MMEFLIKKLPDAWQEYARLMRLDKPIGTFLLLWPTLWSLWLAAKGMPNIGLLTIFILGVILMRAAGCVINDFADRKVDRQVSRTKNRPLASGKIRGKNAQKLFVILIFLAFVLVLQLNNFTIFLSAIALFLAGIYPFMKRYTHLPQVVLGAAFGWSVPMAFAAQLGTVPDIGWLLFLATLLWTVAYDTIYAMMDRAEDIRIGVKSTAILFGDADKIIIGIIQGMFLLTLYLIGHKAQLGISFFLSLWVVLLLFVYQQYRIRNREPANCMTAFKNNNWVGMAIFVGIFLDLSF